MCVVSMIGDHFNEKWNPWKDYIKEQRQWPPIHPFNNPQPLQPSTTDVVITTFPNAVTQEQFDELKKEVEELKLLLARAKKYDENNNEPNCEIEDKMIFLKKVAALVGIDLDAVLQKKA